MLECLFARHTLVRIWHDQSLDEVFGALGYTIPDLVFEIIVTREDLLVKLIGFLSVEWEHA